MNYVRYNFRALRSDASDPSKSPKHWQACSIIILITVLLPQFGMDIFLHMYMNVAFNHIWVISGSIIRAGRIYNVSRSKNVCAKNLDNLPFRNLPLLLNHILVHYSCNKTLDILFFSHPWYNGNDFIFCSKSHHLWMLSRECNNWRYIKISVVVR